MCRTPFWNQYMYQRMTKEAIEHSLVDWAAPIRMQTQGARTIGFGGERMAACNPKWTQNGNSRRTAPLMRSVMAHLCGSSSRMTP
jgi:hypothetical protein